MPGLTTCVACKSRLRLCLRACMWGGVFMFTLTLSAKVTKCWRCRVSDIRGLWRLLVVPVLLQVLTVRREIINGGI